jgi:predicted nucleotidyltransferase
MDNHVFITPAGLTYKPNCDSPEPEHIDIQIFSYEQDESIQDTINDLMELNQDSGEDLDRPFSLGINNRHDKNFWVKRKNSRGDVAG